MPSASTRHRWHKEQTHRYTCQRCGMTKTNQVNPDTMDWETVYQAPGEPPQSLKKVPPCPGAQQPAAPSVRDLAAEAFAAAVPPRRAVSATPAASTLEPLLTEDGRRIIRVIDGELPRIVDEAEAALMEQAGGVFAHGTRPVRVGAWDATGQPPNAPIRQFGSAVLFELVEPWMVEALTRAAIWERWDQRSNDWRRIDAPAKVAKTLLARAGSWRFPHLTGFCESPTLSPAGRVIADPGYDPDTGLYLVHDLALRPINLERETRKVQAHDAANYLQDLFSTFPFVSDSDRAAAVALLMTCVMRRLLPAAPIGGISASTPRTGKSKLARVIALIARGQYPSILNIGQDETETEKRVDAALLDGDPVVMIDNVSRAIRSDTLCQVSTEPLKDARVLGASKKVRCPTNVAWLVTGNNLTMLGDLAARTMMIHLDAGMERPEERTFDDVPADRRDIEHFALAQRPEALRACLLVAKSYIDAGAPDVGTRRWSDFRDWDRLCRSPLIWAGLADPMAASADLRDEDHEYTAMADLVAAWHAVRGDMPTTAAELYALSREIHSQFQGGHDVVYPDLAEAMGGIVGESPRGGGATALGYKLRSYSGRILGKYRIIKTTQSGKKSAKWSVKLI